MEKKLPKVFANPQSKKFVNNEKVYYSKEKNDLKFDLYKETKGDNTLLNSSNKNIYQKLNDIFSSEKYVYKADVEITTKKEKIKTKIIGQNRTHIITMDDKLIPITDIENIDFIN